MLEILTTNNYTSVVNMSKYIIFCSVGRLYGIESLYELLFRHISVCKHARGM